MAKLQIQDPVVGNIDPTDTELKIIEDNSMQRLRYIRQVGFAYLTYPGANHSRFEHSLGTMLVTRQIVSHVNDNPIEELECAGLLHDVGHAAFSHSSDYLLKKYLKTNHEELGEKMIKNTGIKDIIQDSSLSLEKLLGFFRGIGKGQIVTGALGSDRLDYLVRDSYYTGVAYGAMDFQYIKAMLTVHNGKPAVLEKGVGSVESLLIARYAMYSSVYHHHTTLIAHGMYENAAECALASGEMQKEELMYLNDWQMLSRLTSMNASQELANRLLERRLFKRAYFGRVTNPPRLSEIKEAVEKAGLKEGEYTITLMPLKTSDADEINVIDKEGNLVGKISELSPLIKTLASTLGKRQTLLVSCDRSNLARLKPFLGKVL